MYTCSVVNGSVVTSSAIQSGTSGIRHPQEMHHRHQREGDHRGGQHLHVDPRGQDLPFT